jgi:hypothetical protein
MDEVTVNLTEGWNLDAGSNLSGADGRVVFNIYRVTPPGKKERSPQFTFEKIGDGSVVTAFVMKAKAGYEDVFVWYIYKRGGYRIRRFGGQDATSMYWMARLSMCRYFLLNGDRFPREIQGKENQSGAGRFCLATIGEHSNFLFAADKNISCICTASEVRVHGAWREMFLRYRRNTFDEMAAEGDAIVQWIDHLAERVTVGKPERIPVKK